MSGLFCTESDDVLLSEQQKFHEFHMKFFEWQQHLKIRIGFALTERCREMRQRIEATEVCKLFECHAIHFQLEEIMTWLFHTSYMQLSLCWRTTEFIQKYLNCVFLKRHSCRSSDMLRLKFAQQDIVEQWSKRAWNNQTCSYLVAFLRSKLQEILSTPHQEQLQQQQTLRKDEPRELAKKQLLGGQVSVGACVLAESVWEVEERLLCNRTELLQSTKDATSTAQRSETQHSTLQGRERSKTCSFPRRPSTGRLCLKLNGEHTSVPAL